MRETSQKHCNAYMHLEVANATININLIKFTTVML